MPTLVVVDKLDDWPAELPGAEVVSSQRYLTDPAYSGGRGVKVFNLCRRYSYQSLGYYVSLLAQARGHRPLPSVATLQDLRNRSLVKLISSDVEDEIQRSLKSITGEEYTLSVYFGRNLAQRHSRLAKRLFNLFPAPLLRAVFVRRGTTWELRSLRPIATSDVPEGHWEFLVQAARDHFSRRPSVARSTTARWDLAILVNPEEQEPPSNERAIRRFVRVGEKLGFEVEIIGPEDYGRLAEFDALLIRETTSVEHHTYRFSRRAAALGLVVIDDPESIVCCTNKVFLAEALQRAKVPIPVTKVVARDNLEEVARTMDYPCILKQPDSYFSQGVSRVDDAASFLSTAREFLGNSELLIVQEFLPTDFDWRVGVMDGIVLFSARYRMARGHWQIIQRDDAGKVSRYGKVEAVSLEDTPSFVLEQAVAATRVIGNGLYGVDLKQRGDQCWVIEVNDNPNIDADCEDQILGDELYRRILGVMLERVEQSKAIGNVV
ncbi:MAG: RimK family protein [Thermoanaerobaculia bacterium]|nr:RimK family protein [Thermoanaerobaculia bacterium]